MDFASEKTLDLDIKNRPPHHGVIPGVGASVTERRTTPALRKIPGSEPV